MGQDQNEEFEEFKKIEKLQEKPIKIINFLPLNALIEKQMYEMNILKLKDFIMLHSNEDTSKGFVSNKAFRITVNSFLTN